MSWPQDDDGLVIISYTQPDTIAPTSSAVTSPSSPNGTNGWFTNDVTVTFSATDNSGGSGVKLATYDAGGFGGSLTPPGSLGAGLNTDGTTTFSYYAVDYAGNVETANTLTIKLDKTPPAISPAVTSSPNANGWYNGDVSVAFTCDDNLSGVVSCPANQLLTGEGASINKAWAGSCRQLVLRLVDGSEHIALFQFK
jgi:hypothetical protein